MEDFHNDRSTEGPTGKPEDKKKKLLYTIHDDRNREEPIGKPIRR